jgi:hypothetical protein
MIIITVNVLNGQSSISLVLKSIVTHNLNSKTYIFVLHYIFFLFIFISTDHQKSQQKIDCS